MKPDVQKPEPDKHSFSIALQLGSEYSPDCPTGRDDLLIDLSGQVCFENHHSGNTWVRQAQLTPACLQAWRRAIGECDVGQVPDSTCATGCAYGESDIAGADGSQHGSI